MHAADVTVQYRNGVVARVPRLLVNSLLARGLVSLMPSGSEDEAPEPPAEPSSATATADSEPELSVQGSQPTPSGDVLAEREDEPASEAQHAQGETTVR